MFKIICILLCTLIHVHSVTIPKVDSSETFVTDLTQNDLKDSEHTTNGIFRPKICFSDICLKESARLIGSLNMSVDPCENFYEFVCGKYIHDTVLPEDKIKETVFWLVRDQVEKQMEQALFEELQPNEPKVSKLAKTFTQLCMDSDTQNQKGALVMIETVTNTLQGNSVFFGRILQEKFSLSSGVQPLVDILERYGGWPVVKGDNWHSDGWYWLEISKNMSNDGLPANFILDVTVEVDQENTTQNIIQISSANPDFKELALEGLSDINDYIDFMVDVAVMFGANRSRAQSEMSDVFTYLEKMVKVVSRESIKCTIRDIQAYTPNFNWTDFLTWNFYNTQHFNDNETIVLQISDVVLSFLSGSTEENDRTLANYFAWRLVIMSSEFLNDELRQRFYQFERTRTGVQNKGSKSIKCAKTTMQLLPIATQAMYVRRFFDEKTQKSAVNIAKKIHEEFIETLKRVPWMDDASRQVSIRKANAMKFHIGYPDALVNGTLIAEYYKDVELQTNDSYLLSMVRIRRIIKDRELIKLRAPVNENTWIALSTDWNIVNAEYSVAGNSVRVPISILQHPFLLADRPAYMNFGSIGEVIAHEITHGFDNTSILFDRITNNDDRWQSKTVDQFSSKAKCFEQQIDGELTLDENIADNGGIKVAYAAYQKFVDVNGAEPILPGLNFTANQLFWISSARIYCSVTRLDFEVFLSELANSHAPELNRIIGAFSNSEKFSQDFNCKMGSPMNPTNKCEMW